MASTCAGLIDVVPFMAIFAWFAPHSIKIGVLFQYSRLAVVKILCRCNITFTPTS